MDALPFLDKIAKAEIKPFYVLHGDEDFLKRQVRLALQPKILGDSDPEFAVANYAGESADFSSVRNELDTLPFLCERRLIVIEQADTFVTKYRDKLEAFAAKPSKNGVLILEMKTLMATTRLAKLLPADANIVCKTPKMEALPPWVVSWAKKQYGKAMAADAAAMLVEYAGAHMGLLDQELDKLSIYVGDKPTIESKDVDAIVGRSAAADVFRLMDAIGAGDGPAALKILGERFDAGDDPLGILAPLGYSIRLLAKTAYHAKRNVPMELAMDRAGFPQWPQKRESGRKQMKQLGWSRLEKLYDWLLETDLGLKGGNALPPRLQLERLIVKLVKPRG